MIRSNVIWQLMLVIVFIEIYVPVVYGFFPPKKCDMYLIYLNCIEIEHKTVVTFLIKTNNQLMCFIFL